jgi:hypothetical protein
MTRDEEVYPDAESFKPERFIKNGALKKDIRDPRDIVFGFGRRCVLFRFCGINFQAQGQYSSSFDASEYVLAVTWLSAPSGCQSLQSWPRLKLQNRMRLCCLRMGGTLKLARVFCELFCIASFAMPLCKKRHRYTVPFKCSIKPRSRTSLDLIRSLRQHDAAN